jgi:hypothetical protein
MAASTDFDAVHQALRQVMLDHAPGMTAAKDAPGGLVLHAPFANPLKPKEPMFFGMVRSGKAYVGYHLMGLYMNPVLTAQVPPGLKKRMQGLTCFNFTRVDEDLFGELGVLTARCAEGFEDRVTRMVDAYKAGKAGVR